VTERTIILPPSSNGGAPEANYRLTMMMPKRRYLSYLRERWWVVLLCLAAAISAMLALETVRTPTYSSYAQIYLSDDTQISVGNLFSGESQTYFGTQIELLKSSKVQGAAFEKAGITLPPGQKNTYKIDVQRPAGTSILKLQATGPDPALTQRFLQAVITEYLAFKDTTRTKTSQDVLDSLNDQVAKKAADLQVEQDKWAEFQKSNNVAVLEEDGKSAGAYLSQLNLELAKSKLDLDLLNQGIAPVTLPVASAGGQAPTNAAAGLIAVSATNTLSTASTNQVADSDDAAFNSARLDLAVLLGNQEEKMRYMGKQGFEREVARLQKLITIMLQDKRTRLQERMAAYAAAIPVWEVKVFEINDRLAQGQRRKENVSRVQGYYDHLLGMLQNVDLGKNMQQERLSVLQPATPGTPENRSLPFAVALAGIGGLFFSLGLVFVWYLLDDRFVSVRDIKDQYGETILGLVPQIKVPRAKPQQALLAGGDVRPAYVESYRHLRSALLLSSFGASRPQTLLFTSASPREGKTTIAINLARLLAKSGLRVVLVDADVCGGGMNRLLGQTDQLGVLDYLRGDAEATAIVHPTEFDGLLLVPGGTHKELSEGLFLRPKLAELIEELRQNRDFVILDGAPILASDDAALLVPHADAIVLVTRPFYTRSRLMRQALDMLYQRQAKHVSIILNRARADDLAGHYAMNGMTPAGKNGTVAKGKT
jgi:capsular exopolysaccharide synthesis family protein